MIVANYIKIGIIDILKEVGIDGVRFDITEY